jgi:hypothetical protein
MAIRLPKFPPLKFPLQPLPHPFFFMFFYRKTFYSGFFTAPDMVNC